MAAVLLTFGLREAAALLRTPSSRMTGQGAAGLGRNKSSIGTGVERARASGVHISIVLSAASISAEKGKQHRKIKSQSVA